MYPVAHFSAFCHAGSLCLLIVGIFVLSVVGMKETRNHNQHIWGIEHSEMLFDGLISLYLFKVALKLAMRTM